MDDKLYTSLKQKWKLLTEGMVKVPVDEIRSWIDAHFEEFKTKLSETLTKGYNTDIEDYLIVKNPYNNEQLEYAIVMQKSMLQWKGSNLIFLIDANTNSIMINASRFFNVYKNNLKEGLTSGIIHELTHAIDPGYNKKGDTGDNYEAYVNSDKETVAYNREFIDRIKNFPINKKKIILNKIRKGQLFGIKDMDDYLSSLTPENKRKFVNQLVKEIL